MFDARERRIRRTLAHLARQRIAMQLPHTQGRGRPTWVIENTPANTPENADDLLTCLLRGWVEVVEDSMPMSQLEPNGSLPAGPLFAQSAPIYRLTDGGWSIVRGTHALAVWGMIVAIFSLAVAIATMGFDK